MTTNWADRVCSSTDKYGPLVLGIDPILADMPVFFKDSLGDYAACLLEVAQGQVGIVKFQSAFFEAGGPEGVAALAQAMQYARSMGFGIILDAKRGDIGSTANAYARAYLTPGQSALEADCLTVNPYLGPETLDPFVHCVTQYGKGIFVLVKTSNPGSAWLQDLKADGQRICDHVALLLAELGETTKGTEGLSSVGAVIGATWSEDTKHLRKLMPNNLFLSPGLGAQGGQLDSLKSLAINDDPKNRAKGLLVPVSRGISKTGHSDITLDDYRSLVARRITQFRADLDWS